MYYNIVRYTTTTILNNSNNKDTFVSTSPVFCLIITPPEGSIAVCGIPD